jgi:hypothetical protein
MAGYPGSYRGAAARSASTMALSWRTRPAGIVAFAPEDASPASVTEVVAEFRATARNVRGEHTRVIQSSPSTPRPGGRDCPWRAGQDSRRTNGR